jgi:sortase (surface protein transpeptidase)
MKEDSHMNKRLVLTLALSIAGLALTTSPMVGAHTSHTQKEQEQQGAQKGSRRRPSKQRKSTQTQEVSYTCPMHPDVHSKTAGECPKCGMELDLVEKPAAKAKSE